MWEIIKIRKIDTSRANGFGLVYIGHCYSKTILLIILAAPKVKELSFTEKRCSLMSWEEGRMDAPKKSRVIKPG